VDYISNLHVDQNEPDIVVIDHRMPVMDGLEAAKILRKLKPSLKIILASAYGLSPEENGYFDAILRKPFSSKGLMDAISALPLVTTKDTDFTPPG
jgi:CheY-like chemotaxis protein